MFDVFLTSRFKRDLKRAVKRRKNIDELERIIDLLQSATPLPDKNDDHQLTGEWLGHRECHIGPNWLLIYKTTETELILTRTGTHSDLFG